MPLNSSTLLDVDPSIMEKNMKIIEESPMEQELKNMFTSHEPPSRLVKPTPGFCVKTYTKPDNKKVFVNICQTDAIPSPPDKTSEELIFILNSEDPSSYRVPMSIGEARAENDKSGEPATAYDVAINPAFFNKVEKDELFKTFFLTVVFEGLQDKYQFQLDSEKQVILKHRKSMGNLQTHRIQIREPKGAEQKPQKPLIEEIDSTDHLKIKTQPKKELVFRLRREPPTGEISKLIAEFKIPNLVNLSEVKLEVGEDRVAVAVQTFDPVDFFLPCSVDQNTVKARLDRNCEMLSVIMPVVH